MPVFKQNEVFAGRYRLCQFLGQGGFSEVWMAKDQMAEDAVVALKIYAPDSGLDDYGLRQSRNEFSLTYGLSHPHLLKVYHYDVADGSPYLIMPYCPFGSLAHMLKQGGVLSERQVAQVMHQIGAALEEVHGQDPPIIHQDIKPDNILLLQEETFVLADFGISSRLRQTLTSATSHAHALTVAYSPPERFDRVPSVSPASDIFSLGVTLYELCTNSLPWEGAGGQCLLNGAQVPALPPAYAAALSEILEACMSADPAKRPTAAEIKQKGRFFLETGLWSKPKRKNFAFNLNRTLASSLTAAAIGLVALAGFGFYKVQHGKPKVLPPEVKTVSVAADKAANSVEEKPALQAQHQAKTKSLATPKASERLKPQQHEKPLLVPNSEVLPVKTQAAPAKKTDAPAVTKKTKKASERTKKTKANKSKKAKKPLFKTKSNKKKKPKKQWFKKLKQRLS